MNTVLKKSTKWLPIMTAAGLLACLPVIESVRAVDTVFSANGAMPADIATVVDDFRDALGTLNAFEPVVNADGRRQIDWDAAPAAVSTPNLFPGDFFNFSASPRARGIEFTTPGTGLRLSGDVDDGTPTLFTDLNASYANQFQTFSPERLFTAVGSNKVEVRFFSPLDQTTPALVDGFGAVFTDVDVEGSTTIDFYDVNDALLRTETAPAGPSGYLSFLGVKFDANELYRAVITSGNAPIGPDDNPAAGVDIVAMDDFIFGEPVPTPEPAALGLAALGLIGLIGQRRRQIGER